MRLISVLSLLMTALIFTFSSCTKEDAPSQLEEQVITSQDLTTSQNLSLDAEEKMEEAIDQLAGVSGGGSPTCPVITTEFPWGTFPNTITIDFGDACVGPFGRTRKGQIIVEVSALFTEVGATRTMTYQDFYIDDVQLLGTKTLVNNGTNDDGLPTFSRTVTDAMIIYPNGDEAHWDGSQTIVTIEGYDTPGCGDNVWSITGSSSGINRNDNPFSSTIINPLIRSKGCQWIHTGEREIQVDDKIRTVNYGDGNCDKFATVTFANGFSKIVTIHRWWL